MTAYTLLNGIAVARVMLSGLKTGKIVGKWVGAPVQEMRMLIEKVEMLEKKLLLLRRDAENLIMEMRQQALEYEKI